MLTKTAISFAVAVNDQQVFENNFLASPCLREPHPHEILVQRSFDSAAKAYNDAIDKSSSDLIVFVHQDIILPALWLSQLERALDHLKVHDPGWGVLGCYGLSPAPWGHVYSSGRGIIGEPFEHPAPIRVLDEIVLILRKSSGLRFDERLPHFHLYGTDICLAAAKLGMKSYAISAYCIHNTQQPLVLPREFYECYKHIKRVWKDFLPIQTTCVKITRSDFPMYRRKLGEAFLRIRRKDAGRSRSKNVQRLLAEFGGERRGLVD